MNAAVAQPVKVPRTVQQSIPIQRIYQDGIFEANGILSRTMAFTDVNYRISSPERQSELFLAYCDVLNSLDPNAHAQIVIQNRLLNRENFNRTFLMYAQHDGLDAYRGEINRMLEGSAEVSSVSQTRSITIGLPKKPLLEAQRYFSRVHADLTARLGKLGSQITELGVAERLRSFHDFYRSGQEAGFAFDWSHTLKNGHSFKEAIAPDGMEFHADHFRVGGQYGRALFLKSYATYLQDTILSDLCELPRNMLLSVHIQPIPTDQAVKRINRNIMGVGADIARWQRRQNQNQNYAASVPYDLDQMRKETQEMMDDILNRDQRMMFTLVTIVHTADSLEQLNADTETLMATGRGHLCQIGVLRYQQEVGLCTTLPIGVKKLEVQRTLTTEALAVHMPFSAQDVMETGGVYYGINAVSRKPIFCDRSRLLNGNGFILGVSGSGKSFATKREIIQIALSRDDDVLIIDPDGEYERLVHSLQGISIPLSPSSRARINPFDLSYGHEQSDNPVAIKADLMVSICEQIIGPGAITAREKSIIDRCIIRMYQMYGVHHDPSRTPTMQAFYAELLTQPEPEARNIALALEMFVTGSMSTFAEATNCDVNKRVIAYNIRDIGTQLMPVGMLIMLDAIYNRITRNRARGRSTWVYIDEIYLLFKTAYSATFLFEMWKRVRKNGGYATGITQNISDLLLSQTARAMLANSEFLLLFNQASDDRADIKQLFQLSDAQAQHISNSPVGYGLLKRGGSIVPFEDNFPQGPLYAMMDTRPPQEGRRGGA